MSRTDPQVNFRLPANLRDWLADAAKANNRTLTAEIVSRLELSFRLPDQLDNVMGAYKSIDAAHDEKDDLMERMLKVYEAQKALSDLQQQLIDRLLKEQPPGKGPDAPEALEPTVDRAVLIKNLGASEGQKGLAKRLESAVESIGKSRTPKIPGVNTPKRSSKK